MKRSAKQASISTINFKFDGGLSLATIPQEIGDNELTRANNWFYDTDSDMIQVRPGTTCLTASASTLTNAIRALHYYEKSASAAYLCGIAGNTLYQFTATGWATIAAMATSTITPQMMTYHNKLLVADGGVTNWGLHSWDGTTYTTITSSPKATAMAIAGNRVVVNHTGEPDSVYLSKTEDETYWDTTGSAVGLKVGFGDMLSVNGFGVLGTDIIVSKSGDTTKKLYRINISDPTPANWFIMPLSAMNCAQNPQSILTAYNNIFFSDTDGFKSVTGVEKYGDLMVDETGAKINAYFKGRTCYDMKYIPAYNAIFMCLDTQMFVYSERMAKPRFTDLTFGQGIIRSVCQVGSLLFLGGANGLLYMLDEDVSLDETAVGTYQPYLSILRSKTYVYGVDIIVRKLQAFINPILSGTGAIYVVTPDGVEVLVAQIDSIPYSGYLYDATTLLYNLTGYLYDLGASPYSVLSRNRTRATGIALQVIITAGRCGLDKVTAEVAILQGGE